MLKEKQSTNVEQNTVQSVGKFNKIGHFLMLKPSSDRPFSFLVKEVFLSFSEKANLLADWIFERHHILPVSHESAF